MIIPYTVIPRDMLVLADNLTLLVAVQKRGMVLGIWVRRRCCICKSEIPELLDLLQRQRQQVKLQVGKRNVISACPHQILLKICMRYYYLSPVLLSAIWKCDPKICTLQSCFEIELFSCTAYHLYRITINSRGNYIHTCKCLTGADQ